MPPLPQGPPGGFIDMPDEAVPLAADEPDDELEIDSAGLPAVPYWVSDSDRWATASRVARRMMRGSDPDHIAHVARHIYDSDIPTT